MAEKAWKWARRAEMALAVAFIDLRYVEMTHRPVPAEAGLEQPRAYGVVEVKRKMDVKLFLH
jgi:hypothetical protein